MADIPLEIRRDARRYLAQGVYRVSVEDEVRLGTQRSEGAYDSLANQDLAQVSYMDVTGGAYTGGDHVRALAMGGQQVLRGPHGPIGYGKIDAAHAAPRVGTVTQPSRGGIV